MPPSFNAAPKCAGSCGQSVYFAERTLGPGGKVFHKRCLKCTGCGKVLDSGSVLEHDEAPYCKPCHSKSFGTRGYGISHGGLVGEYHPASSSPPTLSPSRPSPARPSPAPTSPAPAQPAPDLTDRRAPLPSAPQLPRGGPPPPPIPPKPVFAPRARASVGGGASAGRTSLGGSAAGGGGGDHCPRCEQVVYAAEAVLASGAKWHKRCLRCAGCSTVLTGANLVEKNGEPWCSKCYAKESLSEQGMMTRPGLF